MCEQVLGQIRREGHTGVRLTKKKSSAGEGLDREIGLRRAPHATLGLSNSCTSPPPSASFQAHGTPTRATHITSDTCTDSRHLRLPTRLFSRLYRSPISSPSPVD